MKTCLALTPGDFNGVGPEIILRILASGNLPDNLKLLICAPPSVFRFYAERLRLGLPPVAGSLDEALSHPTHIIYPSAADPSEVTPGSVHAEAGIAAMECIRIAVELCLKGHTDALCTAPINKESIHLGGYAFPGHTEYLAALTACQQYTMMLVSGPLRVGLQTTHIPLSTVAQHITREAIVEKLHIMSRSLKRDFGIQTPHIAVFGLNPHAGDGGVLGREEIDIIMPAMESARAAGIRCEGPFAADGWFGNRGYDRHHAVLAMYHDQGLCGFKAISFGKGVNFTAGLPIIRTSPDHGTAFDIAGKGIASTDSMFEAIQLAHTLVQTSKGIS